MYKTAFLLVKVHFLGNEGVFLKHSLQIDQRKYEHFVGTFGEMLDSLHVIVQRNRRFASFEVEQGVLDFFGGFSCRALD